MFQPKLIVTDLDGSALRNDKTLSPNTITAFSKCFCAGIPIAIATARYQVDDFAKALHAEFQILTDGTLIYQNNKLIYSNAMGIDTTNAILQELYSQGYLSHIAIPTTHGLFRYPEGSILPIDNAITTNSSLLSPTQQAIDSNGYTKGYHFDIKKHFPYPANKMVVELPQEEIAEAIAHKCHCSQFHYRGENRYTFYHPTAGKLDAIRFLTKQLGITLADVMVFGDDTNDIEMIANCGFGVAMGNALDEVKAAANEITDTNENDGIAKILNKYLRNQTQENENNFLKIE